MEDVVAVRIDLVNAEQRYILTWGRVFDATDPRALESAVLRNSRRFDLGAEPRSATVCPSLREAAEASAAPYFFEQLLWFSRHPIPFGPQYEAWRAERREAISRGAELLYCGRP